MFKLSEIKELIKLIDQTPYMNSKLKTKAPAF